MRVLQDTIYLSWRKVSEGHKMGHLGRQHVVQWKAAKVRGNNFESKSRVGPCAQSLDRVSYVRS